MTEEEIDETESTRILNVSNSDENSFITKIISSELFLVSFKKNFSMIFGEDTVKHSPSK